jgi:thioredoxin reductase (NADPH)
MPKPEKHEHHVMLDDEQTKKLKALFDAMEFEVPVFYFIDPEKNPVLNKVGREVINAVSELTAKINVSEYDLTHELARKWNVTHSPTILFAPGKYRIRWLGVPLGEEGRTFIEALYMLGTGKPGISEASRKILKKIDSPRQLKIFVSPTCPYCPQQAVNGIKAAIEAPEVISLEIVDIQANPEVADAYSAQSVPQTFADEKLIGLGAQPEELFMSSLEKLEQQNVFIPDSDAEEIRADLVIVGGGPAGLTAGIYASRSGLKAVVVERGNLGGQVATTPIVENYPGFTQVGGKALVDIMVTHALEYVQIFPGEEVVDITPGKQIEVLTSRRRFITKAVLLATGAKHRHLGCPGEERLSGRGVSYCSTCDGPIFKGKKVIMAGGGNSALTEALHLQNIGVDVTVVHRRDTFRAQEHLINNVQAANIPVLFNTEVKEISGDKRVAEVLLFDNQTKKTSTMLVDGVFVSIGYEPAVELAKKIGIEITADGYLKKDAHHRTNIPGIYSAGDVEGGYKQIVTAAGQGSEAALSIFEDIVNPYWIKKTTD